MLICPNCRVRLRSHHVQGAVHWNCPVCQGRSVGRDTLNKVDPTGGVERLWERVSRTPNRMGKACPECVRPMSSILAPRADEPVQLDFCTRCELLWMDRSEHENLANYRIEEGDPKLSALHVVLCMIGLPVEHHERRFGSRPWVTWTVIGAVSTASILAFDRMGSFLTWGPSREAVESFSFVPVNPLRNGGLTALTKFFLHGGWLHLLGNMYFLKLFGDDAEDALGKFRYLVLLVLATLMGGAMTVILDGESGTPVIGASGGVYGVVAYYLLSFPRARLGLGGWFTLFRPVFIRAWWVFLIFMSLELAGTFAQVSGLGSVSHLDHLGGAFVGLLFWIWFKPT